VLALARVERAVQDKHFELLTVIESPKIAVISIFLNFDAIYKRNEKCDYLGNA